MEIFSSTKENKNIFNILKIYLVWEKFSCLAWFPVTSQLKVSVFPNKEDAIQVLVNQLCEGQKGELVKAANGNKCN